MKAALIILGNGYDLHHGYATKYEDFIKGVSDLDNNIWYLHLKKKMLYSWVDVEAEINEMVNLFLEFESKFPEYSTQMDIEVKYSKLFFLLGFNLNLPDWKTEKCNVTKTGMDFLLKDHKFINYSACVKLMVEQFDELKDSLQVYINKTIDVENYNYKEDRVKSTLEEYENAIVLNYNYTDTISGYVENSHNIFVHGDVKTDIILGHNNVVDSRFSKLNKHSQQAVAEKHVKNIVYETIYTICSNIEKIDFIVLGHSFAFTDQPIIDWTLMELYKRKNIRIDELKIFHYKTNNGDKADLYEKMYNIESFFSNCSMAYKARDKDLSIRDMFGKEILENLYKYDKVKKLDF